MVFPEKDFFHDYNSVAGFSLRKIFFMIYNSVAGFSLRKIFFMITIVLGFP